MTERQLAIILIEVLNEVRGDLDPEMQVQTLLTFLHAVRQPGSTMKEIGNLTNQTQASMSRNISALSQVSRHGKPGLNLVHTYEDPMERRRKVVELTPKGQKFMKTLQGKINRKLERFQ